MNKMIGKISGADWSKAPEGATHYKSKPLNSEACWYKISSDKATYWNNPYKEWDYSFDWAKQDKYTFVSKEEDLEMGKKEVSKQVSCIEDLEVGMFFKTDSHHHILITSKGTMSVHGWCVKSGMSSTYTTEGFSYIQSWSYTYTGEYTPIVKETEAEIKIKELEDTISSANKSIELAQKQLQEYKEMK